MTTTEERLNQRLVIFQWILGAIASANIAMVLAVMPWAMELHAEIAKAQTILESLEVPPKWFLEKVERNSADIERLEREHAKARQAKQ